MRKTKNNELIQALQMPILTPVELQIRQDGVVPGTEEYQFVKPHSYTVTGKKQ